MKALLIVLVLVSVSDAATLTKAKPWLPLLSSVIDTQWPTMPVRTVPPAQIEQESSWKQTAELITTRERGIGFSQMTITKRYNNFIAAQKLTKMKVSWDNRFDARFHFTYLVLTDKSNFTFAKKFFDDPESQMAGMLIAYNAGPGTILHRRAVCKQPPRTWFGGLETVKAPYELKLLYGRPLWLARNEYPRNILKIRAPKYTLAMKALQLNN